MSLQGGMLAMRKETKLKKREFSFKAQGEGGFIAGAFADGN